jgi:hypothetical protein
MGTVNYASKYADQVDARFTLGALTQGFVNDNYDFVGVNAVNVFSRDLATLNNYTTSGTSRYGTPEELGNAVQTLTLTQDKSFTYVIDRKTAEDTNGTMEAAATLAENIDNVLIPTIDAYRLSVLVANAPTSGTYSEANHTVNATATSADNAYSEFLKVQEILDDDKAPVGGRVCAVTPAFYNYIKLSDSFTKSGDLATQIAINGQVGEIDGVAIVKMPTSYFPSNVDFVITNSAVMPSPIKIYELKIHDDAPGISGSLVEARFYYDAFVLGKKADAIGVHTTIAS